MKPPTFSYVAPGSVEEVTRLLASDPDAKIISGGQSLMPLLAMRLAGPSMLVDLKAVNGLARIGIGETEITIGARVTHHDIESSAELASALPLLPFVARFIAHPQIRSRGTLGGSVAHSDPSAEWPTVLLAMDATIDVVGPRGGRSIAVDDFFTGPFTSSMAFDEVLVAVRVPRADRRWAFQEAARKAGDYGLAIVAVTAGVDADGRLHGCRVAVGACVGTTTRLRDVEDAIDGAVPGETLAARAEAVARDSVQPISDIHGSSEYRRRLLGNLVRRAVTDLTNGQ
ncbi:carbon-monoxide dehydrogenase medium subunit [Flexivirga endophytica]|jgi:Aerobic-type carbon monoxide dehydrogenase, middle subunit CoxM/CutM homologs|uniref:Carbon-monoxide dehydrogenase medium subunit n=1 Tax=Flexivirga endophytica TaxID=1849103 RepID=A0A916SZI3_9MICO|nr:xanthine dehydrogenase family protein subunit M [Flexivirga endophytica]GGB21476.1 carbon-monoxide dehydrogenase medium subunit [Flexivirga endophytica]GHB59129.1 carbon-monoxide dehydrogenase medium subunit [Flexivirga endophytica]